MKEQFIEKRFNASSRAIIDRTNIVINEYQAEGFVITLRQLFYEFVRRGFVPNTENEYRRVNKIVGDGRAAGVIDWNAIEDRTRGLRGVVGYSDPGDYLRRSVDGYAEDLWAAQDTYCEVWIEKDTLIGVIEQTCLRYRVPFFACRGYTSSSGLYDAGQRIARKVRQFGRAVVLHLGDNDPTGLDMTRDNEERLRLFSRAEPHAIEVVRLALNQDQIEQHNVLAHPSKESSWELEALSSRVINSIIVSAITDRIDVPAFMQAQQREEANRAALRNFVTAL